MSRHDQGRRATRHPMLHTLAAAAIGLSLSHSAQAMVGGEYEPEEAAIATTWFRLADPAATRADRAYVTGMRRHHAGALTMAEAYLADPQASSPALRALARAIIPNQRFEIGLLDEVERNLDQPPVQVNLGPFRFALQPAATEGLAQTQRFLRTPAPATLGGITAAAGPVTERDVQFAKAMTIHHQGALDMARGYNASPDARNGFLRLLNVDIVADQSQEIALMRAVIAAFPGDAEAVPVPAGMVHGMEGMGHGGGDHAGHVAAQPAMPSHGAAAAPPAPASPRGHGAHMH